MQLRSSAGGDRRHRIATVALACAVVLAVTPARGAAAPASTPASTDDLAATRLVYLLEYVGTDYANAVRDGQVIDTAEYGEVVRFVQELVRVYGARTDRAKTVVGGLAELQKLIAARAPAGRVFVATRQLLPALERSVGGAPRPMAPPDLGKGRRLYESDCAPCHGETGAGDGVSSGGMEPPPTAFRGSYLERLSPRQVYNAVTLGIDGTAMPSYAGSYGAQQRWDVAFYTMTLRVGFAPKRPSEPVQISLDELASSSNGDLLARLTARNPDASIEEVDHLRAEGAPSPVGSTASASAAARAASAAPVPGATGDAGIAAALQLQDAFSGVAARVFPSVVGVTGYVRDPGWSPEQKTAERGPLWTAANVDALRYPGFRPVRFGSGFAIDDDGFVLSRDQLLRDDGGELVALVDVELADHSHRVANVVGSEPALDLSVLQLGEPDGGTTAVPAAVVLGDSDRLAAGHWLIALGDPPGAEQNLAVGIVAAPPARQCYQQELSATRIQSSLVIAERARGGPVVDIQGRVVGLSVGEPRPGNVPLSAQPATAYVLPINLVLNLYEALKIAHSTRSPWIGISVLELDRVAAGRDPGKRAAALPVNGVAIDDVFTPSPAASADVRPGDFLVALGGHAIQSVGDFQKWMYVLGIGAKVELGLVRDGQPLRVEVTIEPRPAEATTR